jgi:hypothetical protein
VGTPPDNLCGCWFALGAILFDVRLCRFRSMVRRVFVVATGQVRVMSCCLVFSCFMVLCGFLMVSCRVFMMLSCFVMMLCCFL